MRQRQFCPSVLRPTAVAACTRAAMSYDAFSDTSSELSPPPSRLSTPPAELNLTRNSRDVDVQTCYPTPPSSQPSNAPTPKLDIDTSTCGSSTVDEDGNTGPPPAKRRKLSGSMRPRTTRQLDLDYLTQNPASDQNEDLDKLFKALRKKRKIVVVAGAGISVSAGSTSYTPRMAPYGRAQNYSI